MIEVSNVGDLTPDWICWKTNITGKVELKMMKLKAKLKWIPIVLSDGLKLDLKRSVVSTNNE